MQNVNTNVQKVLCIINVIGFMEKQEIMMAGEDDLALVIGT